MPEDPLKQFELEIIARAKLYESDTALQEFRLRLLEHIGITQYAHNFYWLGVPIIQLPQDIQAMQEIMWRVKPDLVIETGIAHGGSLIFSASMLALLEACGEINKGYVVGIDIDIRSHNRKAILAHPLSNKIVIIEGSSIDKKVIEKVASHAKNKKRVLVCLDSNHTHDHVLAELNAYAPLVGIGSYCIVGDTAIEDVPGGTIRGRPWSNGNNPKTAVWEFLKNNKDFKIDKTIESKLILTGSPDGYLKRIK